MHSPRLYTLRLESRPIAELVKQNIILYDATAKVILFGSRARGDSENESDWDFLVLTQIQDTETMDRELRKVMREKIEIKYHVAISLIIKNLTIWESDYSVTNIYESITDEGITL